MNRTAVDLPTQPATEDASALFAHAAVRLGYTDLSPAVVEAVKRGILDTLGVALAATGAAPEEVQPVRALMTGYRGSNGVRALGLAHQVPVLEAIFWFGALAHALDYDDIADAAVVHPSAPVVSAVLPIAQAHGGVTGRDAVIAIAAGQDLIIRLGLALRQSITQYGWLPSAPGVFGAALSSALVLGLDEASVRASLGLALHQTAGTMESAAGAGSAYRAVRDGFNARAGALAAQLAGHGMRGDERSIEGPFGLYGQFFGRDYDPRVLRDGIGVELLGKTIGLKAWPCCGYSQFFLTALEDLLADPRAGVGQVKRVTVIGNSNLLRAQCEPPETRITPRTSIDAKFSLPFQIGKLLARGCLGIRDFQPDGLDDALAVTMARRVRWRIDPHLRAERTGFGPGVVEVELDDGQVLSARADHAAGHAGNPLPWERVVAKFHDCLAAADVDVPPGAADRVVDAVSAIESLPDVGVLVDFLSECRP